ncbi:MULTISPECIES: gamma-glutamylcyclotransferase family protein [Alcanivorax]|uniref:gamma-glutamylcyclotransferase family protein n=1 Tax=Alcanivorax TaxID=59753 RepID=UPI0025BA7FD5|nr:MULTISPECIES: gamma-glutamylcyclotransferase family protein [Alcanivorax]
MQCEYYFAYGSNMNPGRMAVRGMRYRESMAARLDGWGLAFNKRAHGKQGIAYANIVPMEGVVEGVLYRLRDHREIERMDPYEGHPVRYRRECLPVLTGAGEIPTWVYIANPDWQADNLKPERWYLNHLLSGRPWLTDSYYRRLLQVPVFQS